MSGIIIKNKSQRPYDMEYDPSFVVGSSKDLQSHILNTKLATSGYAVCPIYPSMFSDLRNYPRKQYVIRNIRNISTTLRPSSSFQLVDQSSNVGIRNRSRSRILGADRLKFFTSSAHEPIGEHTQAPDMSCFYEKEAIEEKRQKEKARRSKCKNKSVQTLYRESSTQTIPWQPDYSIMQGDPEVVKLDFLEWDNGLPAKEDEIKLIRKRRIVQIYNESKDTQPEEIEEFNSQVILEFEKSQWLLREKEIEGIQNFRLELLQKMFNELHVTCDCRNKMRMRNFIDLKLKEKEAKLNTITRLYRREMRRLESNYKGIVGKYHQMNVVEEHSNYNSELYLPLIRHGSNPKYGHQIITEDFLRKYKGQFYKVDKYKTNPTWIKDATDLKSLKLPGTRLCVRETKWTEPVLKKLHEELKNLRDIEQKVAHLRIRIEPKAMESDIPIVDCTNFDEEDIHESCVILQKILRGRAAQLKIFEGRETCRELINELRSNFILMKQEEGKIQHTKTTACEEQARFLKYNRDIQLLESYLTKLSGNVVGTLLDFLNKEQKRLIDERKIHALVMLVEREKIKREAAESGTRQREIRRRAEHDEIFKQVIKVHQDTVDLYLHDIITEGIEFNSKQEAEHYVHNLSQKIQDDNAKIRLLEENGVDFKEEYIASQMHNFVIPEVQKRSIRDKQNARQKMHLANAHREIYNTMENFGDLPGSSFDGQETSTRRKKHKTVVERDYNKVYYELLEKEKKEKDIIASDIQKMLEDLADEAYKKEVLDSIPPCDPEQNVGSEDINVPEFEVGSRGSNEDGSHGSNEDGSHGSNDTSVIDD